MLLAVVADKTGYPPEMIDPDMGLDADLGIDSIKRVEILSALQEQLPNAPPVKPEHLGTLHTLRQIVEFLCRTGESGVSAPRPSPQKEGADGDPLRGYPGSPQLSIDRVVAVLLAVVADKTGYPPEMIDPDMGLDADLGIDSIKRVEILSAVQEQLPDAPPVKPEHLGTLHTLRQIAEFLCAGERVTPAPWSSPQNQEVDTPRSPILDRRVLHVVPLTAAQTAVKIAAGARYLVGRRCRGADHRRRRALGRLRAASVCVRLGRRAGVSAGRVGRLDPDRAFGRREPRTPGVSVAAANGAGPATIRELPSSPR